MDYKEQNCKNCILHKVKWSTHMRETALNIILPFKKILISCVTDPLYGTMHKIINHWLVVFVFSSMINRVKFYKVDIFRDRWQAEWHFLIHRDQSLLKRRNKCCNAFNLKRKYKTWNEPYIMTVSGIWSEHLKDNLRFSIFYIIRDILKDAYHKRSTGPEKCCQGIQVCWFLKHI